MSPKSVPNCEILVNVKPCLLLCLILDLSVRCWQQKINNLQN